eukprot:scaffold111230_cov51-Phaeocystis_antarctica.AAC.3
MCWKLLTRYHPGTFPPPPADDPPGACNVHVRKECSIDNTPRFPPPADDPGTALPHDDRHQPRHEDLLDHGGVCYVAAVAAHAAAFAAREARHRALRPEEECGAGGRRQREPAAAGMDGRLLAGGGRDQ